MAGNPSPSSKPLFYGDFSQMVYANFSRRLFPIFPICPHIIFPPIALRGPLYPNTDFASALGSILPSPSLILSLSISVFSFHLIIIFVSS